MNIEDQKAGAAIKARRFRTNAGRNLFIVPGETLHDLDVTNIRYERRTLAVQARETYRPSPSRVSAFFAGVKSGRSFRTCW